ncbi:MAG: tetratricopeptide repeat protein [Candidatus Sulfotelmatobacter sp.]
MSFDCNGGNSGGCSPAGSTNKSRFTACRAFALERDGQTKQSIAAIQGLLDSDSLNAPDTGKAWNILALAYEDRGDFSDAQRAYERAIRTLEKLPSHTKDYAMALDDLGGLYLAMGHADLAVRKKRRLFTSTRSEITKARRSLAVISQALPSVSGGFETAENI